MEPVQVMVVDDDPSIRLTLKRWLRKSCGVDAVECADGVEALEKLNEEPADLILLDAAMPEMNGLELLEIVRQDPSLAYLEVVMVSANGDLGQIERALKLGVSDYLVKPLAFQRSNSRIRTAVERAGKLQRRRLQMTEANRPRILVAAPEQQTREAALGALEEHFFCDSVATLGGLFVAAYRQKPELILLAESLPGLDLEKSIKKIQASAGRTKPRFVLLGERSGTEEQVCGLARRLREVPEPDLLRSTLQQLLQNDGIDPHDCGTWVDRLESRFTDAVRECFSSMLGREVRPAATGVSNADAPSWSIELRPPVGGCLLRGSLYAVEDVGRAAAMDMLGLGENELDAEIVDSCMSEALNLFGGRLKAAAGDLRVDLRLGLPERSARRGDAAYEWRQVFHWDDELNFEAVVEAYEDAGVIATA